MDRGIFFSVDVDVAKQAPSPTRTIDIQLFPVKTCVSSLAELDIKTHFLQHVAICDLRKFFNYKCSRLLVDAAAQATANGKFNRKVCCREGIQCSDILIVWRA